MYRLNTKLVSRSKILRKSISLNFILKIIGFSFGYLTLPIILNNLGVDLYGLWITIFTTMSWINYFDMGIGNGLKNKLTESIVRNESEKGRMYITNSYVITLLISILLFFIVVVIINTFSIKSIFHIDSYDENSLDTVILISAFFVCLNFVLRLNEQFYYSIQKSEIVGLKNILYQILSFAVIVVLIITKSLYLKSIALAYGISQATIELLFTFIFFRNYKKLIPKLKYFNKNELREIFNVGLQFFLIQISMLVIYNTDNLIILKYLGAQEVAIYNLTFKLYNIFLIGHSILLTPFWTLYTEAYINRDFKWIRTSLRRFNYLSIAILIILIIFSVFIEKIMYLWVGKDIKIEYIFCIQLSIFVFMRIFNNSYMFFLNGIGKIKIQMFLYIFGALMNFPLSIYFINKGLGLSGVILATNISILLLSIIIPLQTYQIIRKHESVQNEVMKNERKVNRIYS